MAYTQDLNWPTDLLWHYLHETTGPLNDTMKWWFDGWYRKVDPNGVLRKRREIYKMLLEKPDDTRPQGAAKIARSAIPWNQRNKWFVKQAKTKGACDTIVKIFFAFNRAICFWMVKRRWFREWKMNAVYILVSI